MQRRRFFQGLLAGVLVPAGAGPGQARILRAAEQLAAADALAPVISSIDRTDHQIPAVRSLGRLDRDQVRVVDVGRRLDNAAADALNAAINRNAKALADLRVTLDNRPVIKQRLAEHDVSLKDVIGVRADTPGSVVVYVRR